MILFPSPIQFSATFTVNAPTLHYMFYKKILRTIASCLILLLAVLRKCQRKLTCGQKIPKILLHLLLI